MVIPFEKKIEIMFASLDRKSVSLRRPGQLSELLRSKIKSQRTGIKNGICIQLTPEESSLFASSAVEMWHRSIHSFLISSSLHAVSPIWASVSGYYASHYCIRGLAHLLGYFQIHREMKCQAEFQISSGKHYCNFSSKNATSGEHKYYWHIVKSHSLFEKNDLFTNNPEDSDQSDVSHRSKANYFDHIGEFPAFRPLNEEELIDRIDQLEKIKSTSPPIPNRNKFPDIVNVQLVAYYRIVFFRDLVNSVLGNKYTFWKNNRNPIWGQKYINYQGAMLDNLKNTDFIQS